MHPSRIHIQRRKGCDRTFLMSTFRFQDFIASLEVRVTMGQWVTWRRLTNPGSFKSIIPSDPQRSPRFFSKLQPCLSFFQGGILNQKKNVFWLSQTPFAHPNVDFYLSHGRYWFRFHLKTAEKKNPKEKSQKRYRKGAGIRYPNKSLVKLDRGMSPYIYIYINMYFKNIIYKYIDKYIYIYLNPGTLMVKKNP